MAPTNTLAFIALLLAGVCREAVGTTIPVEDGKYVFEYDENGTQITIVETNTIIYMNSDGEVTSIDSEATGRRTLEEAVPARKLEEACDVVTCDTQLLDSCATLDTLCGPPVQPPLTEAVCLSVPIMCNPAALDAACTQECAADCDPDYNVGGVTLDPACSNPNEICCPFLRKCEVPDITGACGDPHMTGFLGQKFDFTGEDGAWYCLLEDGPSMHLNMRVTAPVPSVPEITYITGLSVMTTDEDGVDHTIDIAVTDPHSLESTCPAGVFPCLADGALTVTLDGKESLVAPGEVNLGPGVAVAAANLPGACRSFGFEKYWELKKLQNAKAGRRLDVVGYMVNMGEWILSDPTATNLAECTEYVATAATTDGGLFAHNSEHASFQILTPAGTIRLSHGRLHQVAMRDPTDQFDLPEHKTWQMNVAIDHHDVSLEATGVLGETVVPTVDASGRPIMHGITAIRGSQDEYRVEGPLGTIFTQGYHH